MEAGNPKSRAGFVLTGGRSTRMGRDKAFLEIGGIPLVERIAGRVHLAAGHVTLIGSYSGARNEIGSHEDGPLDSYAALGFPVLPDLIENVGPIGGIFTALSSTSKQWNLIVACDMPGVTVEFLTSLLAAAAAGEHACLVPETGSGVHPLCAVYHRRTLPAVKDAIDHKCFKMQDFLEKIHATHWPVAEEAILQNANTPADWTAR